MDRAASTALIATILTGALLILAGCGDDDETGDETDGQPTIADVLAAPESYDRVKLAGTGYPVGGEGFVLDDGTGAVLVLGFRSEVAKVQSGDDLHVVGDLGELRPSQVREVEDEPADEPDERVARQALREASPEAGEPFLELVSMSGEGGTSFESG